MSQRSMSKNLDTTSSKKANRRTETSDIICWCGASTCYKYLGSIANPDHRYLCCISLEGCGFKRWDDKVPCPGCDNVIPTLLSLMEKKDEMAMKKAKEVIDLKMMLMFSWVFFVYCPACDHNEGEYVGNEVPQDDNFSEVTYAYKEWYDDYDSIIEVLKAEDANAGKEKDVIPNEDHKMEPEEYDLEVLAMAWDYTSEPEDDWYFDPYLRSIRLIPNGQMMMLFGNKLVL
ncbi:putative Post-SET domain-containing protein [Helianthus anomalus]